MKRILLVEDDAGLVITLRERLLAEGFAVDVARSIEEARRRWSDASPNLVILDRMLPGGDGLSLAREWRGSTAAVPCLVLTARGAVEERIEGFDHGVDDYLGKPFAMQELLARVQVLLHRARGPSATDTVVCFGSYRLDPIARIVEKNGRPVELSVLEFDLLHALAREPGVPRTRRELLREVWGHRGPTLTRTVDVHVAQLRKKLEEQPHRPRYLRTVHGHGYRLCLDSPDEPENTGRGRP